MEPNTPSQKVNPNRFLQARHDFLKYLGYIFATESFSPEEEGQIDKEVAVIASRIRGSSHGPALFVHGMMPRSGTVYVGELLRQHPDLDAYPRDLWELPFLERTADMRKVQDKFLWSYQQNRDKIPRDAFLPLFGASLMAYLLSGTPEDKRPLIKVPGVQYLHRFFDVFPQEHLLLLVRDGRDVVHSTLRTWPWIRFWMACLRWRRAARMALYVNNHFGQNRGGFWFARFEDAILDPRSFIEHACSNFGLEVDRFPWDSLEKIPVQGSSMTRDPGKVDWEPIQRPEGFSPIGHWRSWSPWRRLLFKAIAGQELRQLGYGEEPEW